MGPARRGPSERLCLQEARLAQQRREVDGWRRGSSTGVTQQGSRRPRRRHEGHTKGRCPHPRRPTTPVSPTREGQEGWSSGGVERGAAPGNWSWRAVARAPGRWARHLLAATPTAAEAPTTRRERFDVALWGGHDGDKAKAGDGGLETRRAQRSPANAPVPTAQPPGPRASRTVAPREDTRRGPRQRLPPRQHGRNRRAEPSGGVERAVARAPGRWPRHLLAATPTAAEAFAPRRPRFEVAPRGGHVSDRGIVRRGSATAAPRSEVIRRVQVRDRVRETQEPRPSRRQRPAPTCARHPRHATAAEPWISPQSPRGHRGSQRRQRRRPRTKEPSVCPSCLLRGLRDPSASGSTASGRPCLRATGRPSIGRHEEPQSRDTGSSSP